MYIVYLLVMYVIHSLCRWFTPNIIKYQSYSILSNLVFTNTKPTKPKKNQNCIYLVNKNTVNVINRFFFSLKQFFSIQLHWNIRQKSNMGPLKLCGFYFFWFSLCTEYLYSCFSSFLDVHFHRNSSNKNINNNISNNNNNYFYT